MERIRLSFPWEGQAMTKAADQCLTCYGAGETVTEAGVTVLPGCFGEGKQFSQSTKMGWGVVQMERAHLHPGVETEGGPPWASNSVRGAPAGVRCPPPRC